MREKTYLGERGRFLGCDRISGLCLARMQSAAGLQEEMRSGSEAPLSSVLGLLWRAPSSSCCYLVIARSMRQFQHHICGPGWMKQDEGQKAESTYFTRASLDVPFLSL